MDQFIFFLLLTLLIPIQFVSSNNNSSNDGRSDPDQEFKDKVKQLDKGQEERWKKVEEEHRQKDEESKKKFIIIGCVGGALLVCVCCIGIFCGRRRRPIHPGQAAFLPMAMGMDGAPPFPPAQYPQGPLPQEEVPPQSPTL